MRLRESLTGPVSSYDSPIPLQAEMFFLKFPIAEMFFLTFPFIDGALKVSRLGDQGFRSVISPIISPITGNRTNRDNHLMPE